MKNVSLSVYPSQIDQFKNKADLLADKIKCFLNIKVSKFKRYELLAKGIGHSEGHNGVINQAKFLAQSDKNAPLVIFSDKALVRQIIAIFKSEYGERFSEAAQEIFSQLSEHEHSGREAITDEIDAVVMKILTDNTLSLEIEKPEVWCQNMLIEHSIPQTKSSAFLRSWLGLEFDLLPEPELDIDIVATPHMKEESIIIVPTDEVEWTCEHQQCDYYEISLTFPSGVLSPSCPDCDEYLIKT